MIIISIWLWLIISMIMNMSGFIIGVKGMRQLILNILIISPILSWYILYNLLFINYNKNEIIYNIKYKFIQLYNYDMKLSLEISIYEIIVIILLINVSYIINLYIIRYLYKDKSIIRFMSFMMLFTFNMMVLILSNDMISLFIGWEMIGILSLLLISYYNNRIESVRSGLKAIIYNRLGDIFLMLTIIMSINLYNDNNMSLYMLLINYKYYTVNNKILIILGISILISAWAKSTQLGFQPWLLDAMEGPTPVSALLHSATLVTAGVVLLYKFSYILYYNNSLMILLILLTSISCIMNSFSSINYIDVKRIVAYSTCTHISLMLLIISLDILINIREISLLHLFYHGWSKSLIFILCGYLISIFGSQDIRFFGSIYLQLPLLFVIINISLLSIYGFPGSSISSSKDIILEFGLLSIYGSSFLIPFFVILLLSQGYSLGLLIYLLYNNSTHNNLHTLYNYYKSNFLYSFYFSFLFVILMVIYIPLLFHDILLYTNIHVSHNLNVSIDIFSVLSLLGLLLSYYNYRNNRSFSNFINIQNNRLLFDKLWSSLASVSSILILYYSTFFLEYGFTLYFLSIFSILILSLILYTISYTPLSYDRSFLLSQKSLRISGLGCRDLFLDLRAEISMSNIGPTGASYIPYEFTFSFVLGPWMGPRFWDPPLWGVWGPLFGGPAGPEGPVFGAGPAKPSPSPGPAVGRHGASQALRASTAWPAEARPRLWGDADLVIILDGGAP